MLASQPAPPAGEPMNKTATTRSRLVEATLDLIGDVGWSGITTRVIAERAGVNEVTLFRHFGTKRALMAAAVATVVKGFSSGVHAPTDDVRNDLESLALGYVGFVDDHPQLVGRLLPELRPDSEAYGVLAPLAESFGRRVAELLEHHQKRRVLRGESPPDAVRAFVGPLLARALLAHVLPSGDFDAAGYVDRFLHGRAAASPARAHRASRGAS